MHNFTATPAGSNKNRKVMEEIPLDDNTHRSQEHPRERLERYPAVPTLRRVRGVIAENATQRGTPQKYKKHIPIEKCFLYAMYNRNFKSEN